MTQLTTSPDFPSVATLPGLEQLRTVIGEGYAAIPRGFAKLLGFQGAWFEEGKAVFEVTPGEEHMNPIGSVHGGFAATMLDSAMGCAVHSTLPAAARYTTLDLQITYVKALQPTTGPIRAEAEVTHVGGRVATATGRVVDANGTVYALGATTCMVFRPEQ